MSYDEIVPNLFVGDATSAQSFNGVIVNVLESWPQGEPSGAIWMPVLDLGNRASRARLDQVAATIDASLAMGMRVLLHCGSGVERSGLAVAWFLYTKRGMTLPQAYALVQSRRPVVQDRTAWIAA